MAAKYFSESRMVKTRVLIQLPYVQYQNDLFSSDSAVPTLLEANEGSYLFRLTFRSMFYLSSCWFCVYEAGLASILIFIHSSFVLFPALTGSFLEIDRLVARLCSHFRGSWKHFLLSKAFSRTMSDTLGPIPDSGRGNPSESGKILAGNDQ